MEEESVESRFEACCIDEFDVIRDEGGGVDEAVKYGNDWAMIVESDEVEYAESRRYELDSRLSFYMCLNLEQRRRDCSERLHASFLVY